MSRLPDCIVGHHVQSSEMISLGVNEEILAYAASSSILAVAKTSDFVDAENPWPVHLFNFFSLPSLDNYRALPYNNSRTSFPSSSSRWSSPGNYGITVVRVHPTKDYLCVGTVSTGLYLCTASRPLLSSESRISLELTGDVIHSACFLTAGEEVEEEDENSIFPRRSSSTSTFASGNSIPSHSKKSSRDGYLVFSSSFTGGFLNRGSSHRLSLLSVAEGCIVWRCASEPFHSMCSFESNLSFAACSSDNLVQVYTVKKKDFSSLSSSNCREDKHEVREEEPGMKKRGEKSKEEDTEESGVTNDEENHLGQFLLLSVTCTTSEVWGSRPTFVSCATFPTAFSNFSTASRSRRLSSTSLACLPHFKVKKGEGDEAHEHAEEPIVKNEKHNESGTEKDYSIEGKTNGSVNQNFFVALTSNGILVEYDQRSGAVSKWMDCKDPQAVAVSISKKYIIVCGSAVRYFNVSNWEFSGIHSPLEKQSWGGNSLSSSSTPTSFSSVAVFCSLLLREASLSVVFLRSGSIFAFGVAESFIRGSQRTVFDGAASGNHEASSMDIRGKESRILQFKLLYHYTPLVDPPLLGVQGALAGGGGGTNRDGDRGGGMPPGSPHPSSYSMISSAPLQWVQPSLETEHSNGPQPLPCALWCSLGIRAIYSKNLYTVAQHPLRFNCGVFDAQRDALFAQCRQTNEITVLDPYAMWEVRASVSVPVPLISLAVSHEGVIAGLGENHKVFFFTCKESNCTFLLEDSKASQSLSGRGLFHQLLFLGEKLYAVANTYLMNTSSKKEYHWNEPILQVVPVGRYHFLLLFSNYCEVFDPSDPDEHLTVFSLPFTAKAGVSMTVEPHYQQLVVIEQDGRLLVFNVEGTGTPLLFFDYTSRSPGLQIKLSALFRSSRDQSWRLLVADSEGVVSIYDIFPDKTSQLELHPPSSTSSNFMWRKPPLPPSMKIQSERPVFKRWSSEQSKIVSLSPPKEGEFSAATLCARRSTSSSQNKSKEKVLHSSRLLISRGGTHSTVSTPSCTPSTPAVCPSAFTQEDQSEWKSSPLHDKEDQDRRKQSPGVVSSSSAPCSKELSNRFSELTNFFHTQELRGAFRSERLQGQKASSHVVPFSSPVCTYSFTQEKERAMEWDEERKVKDKKRQSEGEKEKGNQKISSVETNQQLSSSFASSAPSTKEPKSSGSENPPSPPLSNESKGGQDSGDRSATPAPSSLHPLTPSTVSHCTSDTNEHTPPHREEDDGPLCHTVLNADDVSNYPALSSSPSPALHKTKSSLPRLNWTKGGDRGHGSKDGAPIKGETNTVDEWSTSPIRVRGSDADVPAEVMQGTSAPSISSTSLRVGERWEEETVPFLYAMRHEGDSPEAFLPIGSPFAFLQDETGEEEEEVDPRQPPDQLLPRSTTPVTFSVGHRMACTASFIDPSVAVENCGEEKESGQEKSMQKLRCKSRPHLRQSIVELTDLLSGRERVAVLQKHPNEFLQLYESLSATLQKSNASSVSTAFSGLEPTIIRQEESWESQQLRSEMRRIQEQNEILVAQSHEILRVLQEEKKSK